MSYKSHLDDLVARLVTVKKAADGFNSSMPDDPTGDGTTDYDTGAQYDQYAKDLAAIETVPPNADSAPVHSMTEDQEQENSLTSYTLSEAGSEEQSSDGEYEDRPEDPGTSMPAEAGQEKFSSARNCSLEQNIAIFRKCAESIWQTKQAYAANYDKAIKEAAYIVSRFETIPVGSFTKQALDEGCSPEECNDVAAVEALADEDPELLEALAEASPEELAELAEVAEQIEASEGGDADTAALAEDVADTEEKMASYAFTKRALDEGASPEEATEVAAVETLAQEDPELLEALAEATPEELAELAEVAEQIEATEGGDAPVEEEISPAEAEELEKQSFFSQGPTNQQLLASLSDGQLKTAAANIDKAMQAVQNNAVSDAELNQILAEDEPMRKQAGPSSEQLYTMALQKKAEEEAEVFESLPPEYQEALANASDEELEDLITLGEAAQNDPAVLEQVLSGEGGDEEPTSDEALNELASAMEEEGITPERLEEASKQASCNPEQRRIACNIAQKVAAFIRSGKHTHGPATTEKAARARYLSHQYLNEILR